LSLAFAGWPGNGGAQKRCLAISADDGHDPQHELALSRGPVSLRLAAWEKEPDVIVSLYEDKVELDLLAGQLSCACSDGWPVGARPPQTFSFGFTSVVQACACLGWLGSVLVPMASLPMAATDRASAQLHVGADSIGRLSRCLHDGLRGDFRRLCTTDGYPAVVIISLQRFFTESVATVGSRVDAVSDSPPSQGRLSAQSRMRIPHGLSTMAIRTNHLVKVVEPDDEGVGWSAASRYSFWFVPLEPSCTRPPRRRPKRLFRSLRS